MATTKTRSSPQKDKERLLHALMFLLGMPNKNHEVIKSLLYAGVDEFNNGFLLLSEDDIDKLVAPIEVTDEYGKKTGQVEIVSLGIIWTRKLKQLLAYFHYASRASGEHVDIQKEEKAAFDEYRISKYNPNEKITPWNCNTNSRGENTDLANWKKQVRPSKSDYKELKDGTYWQKHKEHVKNTIASQGLTHLIEEDYVPPNEELDIAQRQWLYSVFESIYKDQTAAKIVIAHIDDKDTRAIWKELCEELDNSMTTELRSEQLSTFLSSTRLDKVTNWRKGQESFILHWAEKARTYNEITPDAKFNDKQLVRHLSHCVSQVPNLATVLNTWKTAQRATGRYDQQVTFAEYVQLLQTAAQTYDGSRKSNYNPRASRSVNVNEMREFDDDPGNEYELYSHEAEEEEFDRLFVFQSDGNSSNGQKFNRSSYNNNSSGTSRVRMDYETWKSLSKTDQDAWDGVSDDGKKKILEYVTKRMARQQSANVHKQSVNTHIFEDDDEDKELETNKHEENSKIEASTHDTKPYNGASENTKRDLLYMATHNSTKEDYENYWDICHVLSQESRSTNFNKNDKSSLEITTCDTSLQEDIMPRSDFTPECFHTEMIFDNDDDEIEEPNAYDDVPLEENDDASFDEGENPPRFGTIDTKNFGLTGILKNKEETGETESLKTESRKNVTIKAESHPIPQGNRVMSVEDEMGDIFDRLKREHEEREKQLHSDEPSAQSNEASIAKKAPAMIKPFSTAQPNNIADESKAINFGTNIRRGQVIHSKKAAPSLHLRASMSNMEAKLKEFESIQLDEKGDANESAESMSDEGDETESIKSKSDMMKPPFQNVPKPPSMSSRITPSEDGSKHTYKRASWAASIVKEGFKYIYNDEEDEKKDSEDETEQLDSQRTTMASTDGTVTAKENSQYQTPMKHDVYQPMAGMNPNDMTPNDVYDSTDAKKTTKTYSEATNTNDCIQDINVVSSESTNDSSVSEKNHDLVPNDKIITKAEEWHEVTNGKKGPKQRKDYEVEKPNDGKGKRNRKKKKGSTATTSNSYCSLFSPGSYGNTVVASSSGDSSGTSSNPSPESDKEKQDFGKAKTR